VSDIAPPIPTIDSMPWLLWPG